jgi:hypothetical protein
MSAGYPFSVDANGLDDKYPGTATHRLTVILTKVRAIPQATLDGPWERARVALLGAGGLRADQSTSHAFNDANHCDLTPMVSIVQESHNAGGEVAGISRNNQLGPYIQAASIVNGDFAAPPGTDAGGSWSTCMIGANQNPPHDVAHVQFKSRVAFKLVWCPPAFEKFVLVDDEGNWLRTGTPSGGGAGGGALPDLSFRKGNFEFVAGGKYERVAREVGGGAEGDKI